MRIAWHGDFVGEGSLARVNRNLARALLKRGVDVVPYGEPMPAVEELLGLAVRDPRALAAPAPVTLRHRWPPAFMNPPGTYVHVQPWEFGVAPRSWADALNARADDVWCYTRHVRETYVAAGVDPERVHVVPLGVDPAVYHPQVEPLPNDGDRCIFLFVGGMIERKNLAGVVSAYVAAFRPDDAVALIVKDDPAGHYDPAPVARLRELAARTDVPPLRYVGERYRDADMARLMRTATALVQPSRGEGFGLPVIEAMACGTPVVVAAGGATDDFVDEQVGWRIPAARRSIGPSLEGIAMRPDGWLLEPDLDALAATLRAIYEQRAGARARGAAASERARASWTWDHAAARAIARLDALDGVPPRTSDAPDDPQTYAYRSWPQHAEAGIVVEVFARLRVTSPAFVDISSASGDERPTALLGGRYQWTRVGPEQAGELDLLALDAGDAQRWTTLAALRPRVAIVYGAAALALPDYVLLATGSAPACTIFLRRDLVAATGFSL